MLREPGPWPPASGDVVTLHMHLVARHVFARRRPKHATGGDVESSTVQGAGHDLSVHLAFRERTTHVRTAIPDGVVQAIDVEERHLLVGDFHAHRLAGRQVVGLRYFGHLAHVAHLRHAHELRGVPY